MHDKNTIDYANYDDHQLIASILNNEIGAIQYYFNVRCSGVFTYIIDNIFDGNIDKRELPQELFLYLAENNWHKVRQFDFRSKFITWTSVVAVRFFQKKREALIGKSDYSTLNNKRWHEPRMRISIEQRMDLQAALQKMPNSRYRKVIEQLDLLEIQPEDLAKEMEITIDNLYNIHRRALIQLRLVMGRKEDYYG